MVKYIDGPTVWFDGSWNKYDPEELCARKEHSEAKLKDTSQEGEPSKRRKRYVCMYVRLLYMCAHKGQVQ